MNSLGVIETRGLIAAIHAADAACKAASVEIIGYRKIGSGLVSICFQGEISAVRTAIDSGIAVVSPAELVVGSLVIARPESHVIQHLNLTNQHQFFAQPASQSTLSTEKNPTPPAPAELFESAEIAEVKPIEPELIKPDQRGKAEVRKGKKQ